MAVACVGNSGTGVTGGCRPAGPLDRPGGRGSERQRRRNGGMRETRGRRECTAGKRRPDLLQQDMNEHSQFEKSLGPIGHIRVELIDGSPPAACRAATFSVRKQRTRCRSARHAAKPEGARGPQRPEMHEPPAAAAAMTAPEWDGDPGGPSVPHGITWRRTCIQGGCMGCPSRGRWRRPGSSISCRPSRRNRCRSSNCIDYRRRCSGSCPSLRCIPAWGLEGAAASSPGSLPSGGGHGRPSKN